jgi:superfamily II DNA/RNA helicase
VHRIGRTGRAGRSGQTFMIVTPADARGLDKVLKLIGKAPNELTLGDIDFASIKSEPREGRGRREGGRDRDRGRSRGRREPAPETEAAPVAEERPRREPKPPKEPREPRESRPEPARARQPRPEPARDRERSDEERGVVGFGADTPAFLMRAPARTRPAGSEK